MRIMTCRADKSQSRFPASREKTTVSSQPDIYWPQVTLHIMGAPFAVLPHPAIGGFTRLPGEARARESGLPDSNGKIYWM